MYVVKRDGRQEPVHFDKITARINKLGASYLDAPVSGGEVGAKAATLTIMVGGPAEAFDQVKPLFELMGKNITLVGGNGDGKTTKGGGLDGCLGSKNGRHEGLPCVVKRVRHHYIQDRRTIRIAFTGVLYLCRIGWEIYWSIVAGRRRVIWRYGLLM